MSRVLTKIPYVNLKSQWKEERKYLLPLIDSVLGSGQYVGGKELKNFEYFKKSQTQRDAAPALFFV